MLRFVNASTRDKRLVGGKGANLGVITEAYREFLASGDLGGQIAQAVAQVHYDRPERRVLPHGLFRRCLLRDDVCYERGAGR
jgi:phosphoenolpyruvate synthase/pyruvate phosphate dikinase